MTPAELLARLDSHPRIALGETPTALQRLERLSAELGRPLFVKRDDLLGPALGGNKTRKLEYLLAEARQQGATKVVTFGGLQSNHARLTAAAASLLGLEAHLLYFEPRPKALTGNLLLNELLGARMHFFPLSPKRPRPRSLESTIRLARLLARLRVGPHYFIPVGGHTRVGALGYVRAAAEIDEQARDRGIPASWSGSRDRRGRGHWRPRRRASVSPSYAKGRGTSVAESGSSLRNTYKYFDCKQEIENRSLLKDDKRIHTVSQGEHEVRQALEVILEASDGGGWGIVRDELGRDTPAPIRISMGAEGDGGNAQECLCASPET